MLPVLPPRVVATTLLTAALGLGVLVEPGAEPVAAQVPWEPSVPVARTEARALALAVEADGDRHVVRDVEGAIFYDHVAADGTVSPPARLSLPGRQARFATVVALGDDRAVALWVEVRETLRNRDSVLVSRPIVDGDVGQRAVVGVGPPIRSNGHYLTRPRVAIVPGDQAGDQAGDPPARVLATWLDRTDGGSSYVRARDLDPGTGAPRSQAFTLASDFSIEETYDVAADADTGAISVVWTDVFADAGLRVVTLPAGSRDAGDPVDLLADGRTGDWPTLVAAPGGNLVVGWSDRRTRGSATHLATVDPTSGIVLDRAVVSRRGTTSWQEIDLALDPTGRLTVAWSTTPSRPRAGSAWARQVRVRASGALEPQGRAARLGRGGSPRVVVDPDGQATVVRQELADAHRPIAVRFEADGTLGSPRYLLPFRARDAAASGSGGSKADDDAAEPTLDVGLGASGRVDVLWSSPAFGVELSRSRLPGAALQPAETFIRKAPPRLTDRHDAVFLVGTPAVDARLEYRLDGGRWREAPRRRVVLEGLADGEHRFDTRAIDTDGTPADPTPARWTWRIDG